MGTLSSFEWLMARVGDGGPAIGIGLSVVFARHCVVGEFATDTGPLSYPGNTG